MNKVPVLKLDVLPKKLRENWHVVMLLRSDACVRYALAVANEEANGQAEANWVAAFDKAALEWDKTNPIDPMWSTGCWPEGASIYPGHEALEDARAMIANSHQSA